MAGIKKQQACMECTKKCLKTHGKMPSPASSSTPLSFFKIMIGDFREVLFIPPKFSLLNELVNQSVYLEDSDGNSSRVKLSVKDGYFAFQEGWHEFVLDHAIGIGEFVVFKYIGELSFSVQIFGVSACERLCFHEKNKSNLGRKNRNMTELSPEELQLPKRHKSSEALKDKRQPVNENPLKKEVKSEDDLSDLPDVEFIASKLKGYLADLPDIEFVGGNCAEKDENEPVKSPHSLGNSRGLQTGMALSLSKQTLDKIDENVMSVQEKGSDYLMDNPEAHGMAHKDSVQEQETSTIPDINKLDPKTVETNSNSDDAEIAVQNEEKSYHCDESCRISQMVATVECSKSVTKSQMNSSWDIIIYTPKNDCSKEPNIDVKQPMREGVHKTDIVYSADPKILEDEVRNLVAKDKVSSKFLLTEGGVCHIFDENLTAEYEASRVTPINLFENDTSRSCNKIVDMAGEETSTKWKSIPEISFPESTLVCNDDEKYEEIREGLQSEEGLGSLGNNSEPVSRKEDVSCADSVASAPQNMPDINVAEGIACQSGIVPDDYGLEDEEKVTSCLKQKTLNAWKTERMDSDDLDEQFAPKSISLSFTVSSNVKSWIELPQSLPCCLGKKRQGMRVLMLQDPHMRLWPIMYHESFKFVGFLSGWKDFAAANNLQQGNLCELFKVPSEWEPTFQVRISEV